MATNKTILAANYLVEFKRNKFRISLPSRRENPAQSEVSSSVGEQSILPLVEQLPWTGPHNSASNIALRTIQVSGKTKDLQDTNAPLEQQQEYYEFVFFNEDLLSKLNNVLCVLSEANGDVMLDDNLMPIVNFRCMIYNNDVLCFNLLIRCDGHVINTTNQWTGGFIRNGSMTCLPNSLTRSSIPNQTKVFDQSIIYLFKETSNLPKAFSANIESDTTTNADEEEVLVDMQVDEEPRQDQLANTQPNLDTLPHTISTFSVSSETDDETVLEVASERIDECSLLSTEMDEWDLETEQDLPPRVSLEDEQDREEAKLGDRPYEFGSMSTIYSEESFEVVVDEDENKLREFDLYSTEAEEEPDPEPHGQTEHKVEVVSLCSDTVKSEKSSLKSPKSPKVVDDPYENAESLQAQERSLEEKDLVYTQTMEIVSDDEYDGEGRRREKSKSDELSTLLDKMPLQDVRQTMKYIRDNLLLQKADIKKRQQLVSRMEKVLCDNGFNCHLYIFGSTKNWLGLRSSSDIDIFIQLKDSRGRPIDETHISYGKIEHVLRRIDRILGDDQSYLEVLTGPSGNADISIQTICHRHMRVPITRLKIYLDAQPLAHPSSSSVTVRSISPDQVLQCDLNANNALGIANTRLIRFLCKFEPRFFVLNVLLRFWSKYVAYLNKPDALSSYALTNMILFYCQMRKPQILPPVDYFVKLSTQPKIVNDWRCDFCKDRSRIEFRTQNTESIMQLFVGFFRYYNSFNFLQFKISTRYGRAWRLRNNHNRRQMAARIRGGGGGLMNRRDADRMPSVHIMDPFEQSHNLTARMRTQMYDRMCLEFNQAAERYRKYI